MLENPLSQDEICKLVSWVVSKIRRPRFISSDDLFQEGWLAAQKAIERFREDKGAKLSSWVVTVVAGYLKCYVEAEAKRLRVPAALARDVSKFDRSVESLESSLDVSALLEILRKVLSPLSRKILLIQLAAFPRRVGKEQISEYLSVNLTAVDNLYAELRQAVMSIRRLM